MEVIGRVIKKIPLHSPSKKIELVVEDFAGVLYSLQVRPKFFISVADVDTGHTVEIKYRNELSESNGIRINNLIVESIINHREG